MAAQQAAVIEADHAYKAIRRRQFSKLDRVNRPTAEERDRANRFPLQVRRTSGVELDPHGNVERMKSAQPVRLRFVEGIG